MSNSHSLIESETFFIQLFVTNLWTCYFQTLAHQPSDKFNLKINKYFESTYKKANIAPMNFQHDCRGYTGGTRRKSSSISGQNVTQSTPPSSYGKEQQIWLLAPGKGCTWSHWMISKYICINDIPKITIQVFHCNISRKNLPGWLQKCVFLHRVSNIFQGDVQHL